ncbi:MAG: carbohydrate ABC transporter permease [Candidatus Hydrogenedentes bacterium]|nr:carbohydrate ABC transporter permease [Candidatus Hydrogenedentota bacterium]
MGSSVAAHVGHTRKNPLTTAAVYASLLAACMLLGLPFFWMVVTSLKSPHELAGYPPSWWPESLRWGNYIDAWRSAPFGRMYVNSLITGLAATALQVGLALLMAYAFAFIRFPARRFWLLLVLATMMIPDEMKLVPNYLTLSRLDWINTYWALIVPPAAHAFPVFVFYQQFRMLPSALIDAAKADGAGHGRILWRVVLPMSRPVLVAVTLVSFLGRWNDFLWPLIVTDTATMRTLPVGLAYLKKQAEEGASPWHLMMAAALFIVIPIVILYSILQKQFVEGITKGAIKG